MFREIFADQPYDSRAVGIAGRCADVDSKLQPETARGCKKNWPLKQDNQYTKYCISGWWFGTFVFFSIFWDFHHSN